VQGKLRLEQIDVFVRPNPRIIQGQNTSQIQLFLDVVTESKVRAIEELARNFVEGLQLVLDTQIVCETNSM
jgi:hypothetical protein